MASFTKEVNSWSAKRQVAFNDRLAHRGLTSLVEDTTGIQLSVFISINANVPNICISWDIKDGEKSIIAAGHVSYEGKVTQFGR